jgi:hypothetical protein
LAGIGKRNFPFDAHYPLLRKFWRESEMELSVWSPLPITTTSGANPKIFLIYSYNASVVVG